MTIKHVCANRLVVVAAGVRSPINLASIFRLADALHCREVLLVDIPDAGSRRKRRVSTGRRSGGSSPFLSFTAFDALRPVLGPLIAVELTDRAQDMFAADLPPDGCFVAGNERHGIPPEVLGGVTVPSVSRCLGSTVQ